MCRGSCADSRRSGWLCCSSCRRCAGRLPCQGLRDGRRPAGHAGRRGRSGRQGNPDWLRDRPRRAFHGHGGQGCDVDSFIYRLYHPGGARRNSDRYPHRARGECPEHRRCGGGRLRHPEEGDRHRRHRAAVGQGADALPRDQYFQCPRWAYRRYGRRPEDRRSRLRRVHDPRARRGDVCRRPRATPTTAGCR